MSYTGRKITTVKIGFSMYKLYVKLYLTLTVTFSLNPQDQYYQFIVLRPRIVL